MALHTRLCDRFGIEHPIVNAPMGGGDAPAELAAAVANAGGLGMIGGTTMGGAPWLADQIRRAQELTDRPFGVGIISHFPNAAELMGVALDEGVRDHRPFVRRPDAVRGPGARRRRARAVPGAHGRGRATRRRRGRRRGDRAGHRGRRPHRSDLDLAARARGRRRGRARPGDRRRAGSPTAGASRPR